MTEDGCVCDLYFYECCRKKLKTKEQIKFSVISLKKLCLGSEMEMMTLPI